MIEKYSVKRFTTDIFSAQSVREKLRSLNAIYFSGHRNACEITSPDHPCNLYASGGVNLLSTNYYYLTQCPQHSALSASMPKGIGAPSSGLDPELELIANSSPYDARCTWAAAFISSPKLVRGWHVDWYDNILVPLQGRKTIHFIDSPIRVPESVYSYSNDHGYQPSEEEIKKSSIIDVYPGEVLAIPSFCPHKVVNDPNEECVAVSLAFDQSYPLAYFIPSLYTKVSEGRWGSNPKHLLNLCNYRVVIDEDLGFNAEEFLLENGEPKEMTLEKIMSDLYRNQVASKKIAA